MSEKLTKGDIVRVKCIEIFTTTFAKRIKDRDAVVIWVGPDANGMNEGYCKLLFKKRNGRGKEFSERMKTKWITKVTPNT